MDLPEEVLSRVPRWRRMGYEPHCVSIPCPDGECTVVFRTLTKREFEEYMDAPRPAEVQALGPLYDAPYKEIVRLTLLWPEQLPDDLPAGADRKIAEAVVEASAWTSPVRLVEGLQDARDYASSLEAFLHSRICSAFPLISPEKLTDMRFAEMMRLAALSEVMTGVPIDLQPWLDPEGYNRRMKAETARARGQAPTGQIDKRLMRDPALRRALAAEMEHGEESISRAKPFDLDESRTKQMRGLMGI